MYVNKMSFRKILANDLLRLLVIQLFHRFRVALLGPGKLRNKKSVILMLSQPQKHRGELWHEGPLVHVR